MESTRASDLYDILKIHDRKGCAGNSLKMPLSVYYKPLSSLAHDRNTLLKDVSIGLQIHFIQPYFFTVQHLLACLLTSLTYKT